MVVHGPADDLEAVLARRLAALRSVRPSTLNRHAWRMADDRYFHRLDGTGRAPSSTVVNTYTRDRDEAMRTWPGAAVSRVSWGPGTTRGRRRLDTARHRIGETAWQWTGWLLSPRFPVH